MIKLFNLVITMLFDVK